MNSNTETVTLQRDVIGILIPAGTKVELPEGGEAIITQALGGSYTIQMQGHLFRIDGKDADALGKPKTGTLELPDNPTDFEIEKAVWAQLRTCYDPEIPVNIVELGLIYECQINPHTAEGAAKGEKQADIRMTLTAAGCGMGDILVGEVKEKALQVPKVKAVNVDLTFDPPWTRDMMSEEAQLQVGF
jgi:probable FeS assembly SUF system protein SufT